MSTPMAIPVQNSCSDICRYPCHNMSWPRGVFWVFVLLISAAVLTELVMTYSSWGHLHYTGYGRGAYGLLSGSMAGLFLFGRGLAYDRTRALVERVASSAIGSLSAGLTKICGTVRPNGPLQHAPISGIPCVFWYLSLEEVTASWDGERKLLFWKGTDQPFFLDDETGEIEVVPRHAELFVQGGQTFTSTPFRAFPLKVSDALERLDMGSWRSTYRSLICRESLLIPGGQAFVLGTAKSYHGTLEQASPRGTLYIGSGPDDHFLITDYGEKELETSLAWKAAAMLYGGPALTLVCIVLFLMFYTNVMR